MPLTNAQKQRRFRDRNVIVLTDRAEDIAEKPMDMEDQKKLRKIAKLIGNHLKNPNRSGRAQRHWTVERSLETTGFIWRLSAWALRWGSPDKGRPARNHP
jgi:hypothetical protein